MQRALQLPRSSTRLNLPQAFCRIVRRVGNRLALGWEGKVYPPGAVVPAAELPDPLVVIECAGSEKPQRKGCGRQPVLWILWSYDEGKGEWAELARSLAMGWEWSLDLAAPARRALDPRAGLVDVLARGRSISGDVVNFMEQQLEQQPHPIRLTVWSSLYDEISGRLANADEADGGPLFARSG